MHWALVLLLVLAFDLPCWGQITRAPLLGDLSGSTIAWFYGYYGQLGSRGFFGDYNVDAGAIPGEYASLNGWVGNQDTNSLVTGTNAGKSSIALSVDPKYGNDWISLGARYTINPYVTGSSPGPAAPISPGQLTTWQLQVNTPIADITVGKQIFSKGFNLQFSGNRTQEYLLLQRTYTVPNILDYLVSRQILPRKALSWFNREWWPRYKPKVAGDDPEKDFLGRDKSISQEIDERLEADPFFSNGILKKTKEEQSMEAKWPSDTDGFAWGHRGPGCLRVGIGFYPWQVSTTQFGPPPVPNNFIPWNQYDLGVNPVGNFLGTVQYSSADLEIGVGCSRFTYHQGPELQQGTAARVQAPTFENYVTEGWAYLKYSNGRYFLNTELDWFNRVYRFQKSLDGTFFGRPDNVDGSGSVFASRYWESWRYMAEVGWIGGALSGRLFYCFMPGPDRRHGIYIDRQPYVQEYPQQAFGLFDPYSILLSYKFGSGVNAPGYISDASVFATRLDYAIAANLIVEGSFLYAQRNSNGYALGFVRPNGAPFGTLVYGEPGTSTFINPAPSIPERELGWEAIIGFTWELMSGYPVAARMAYWQPGKWFNYACVDKSVPNWDLPSAANSWGIKPDRVIDPIIGFELQLGATF
jgi:hypothetical protein